MQRIRIKRRPIRREEPTGILPLDPRDPDVVRAKEMLRRREQRERRRRVA